MLPTDLYEGLGERAASKNVETCLLLTCMLKYVWHHGTRAENRRLSQGERCGAELTAPKPLPATCLHAMLGVCRLFGRRGIHKNPAARGSIGS